MTVPNPIAFVFSLGLFSNVSGGDDQDKLQQPLLQINDLKIALKPSP